MLEGSKDETGVLEPATISELRSVVPLAVPIPPGLDITYWRQDIEAKAI